MFLGLDEALDDAPLPWGAPTLSAYYSASADGRRKAFNPFKLPWLSAHTDDDMEGQDRDDLDNGWGQPPASISPFVQAFEKPADQVESEGWEDTKPQGMENNSVSSADDGWVQAPLTDAAEQHQECFGSIASLPCPQPKADYFLAASEKHEHVPDHSAQLPWSSKSAHRAKDFADDYFDLLCAEGDDHRSFSVLEHLFTNHCKDDGDYLDWLSDGDKYPTVLGHLFALKLKNKADNSCTEDWLCMVDDDDGAPSLLGRLFGIGDGGWETSSLLKKDASDFDWLDNADSSILVLERLSRKWKASSFRDDEPLPGDKYDWLDSDDGSPTILARLFTDWEHSPKDDHYCDWLDNDDHLTDDGSRSVLECLFDNPQAMPVTSVSCKALGVNQDRDFGQRDPGDSTAWHPVPSSAWKRGYDHGKSIKDTPGDPECGQSLEPSPWKDSAMQDCSPGDPSCSSLFGDPNKWKGSSLTDSSGDTFSSSHDSGTWNGSNPSCPGDSKSCHHRCSDPQHGKDSSLSVGATFGVDWQHSIPPGHVYHQGRSQVHHPGFLKQVQRPWVSISSDTDSDKHGWGSSPPVNKTAWKSRAFDNQWEASDTSPGSVTDSSSLDRHYHLSRSPDHTRLLLLLCGHILETWWKAYQELDSLGDPNTTDWTWILHHQQHHCYGESLLRILSLAFPCILTLIFFLPDTFTDPVQHGRDLLSGSTSQVAVF